MKRKERRKVRNRNARIWLIAVAVWLIVIFCMSAAPAQDSTVMSLSVGRFLGDVFVPGFKTWSAARQTAFARSIDFVVRKCAHAAEYAVLGVLVSGWLRRTGMTHGKNTAAACICFCFLYACTDELHQLFVPGRACRFMDVLIDTGGALCGMGFYLLVSLIWRKIRGNRCIRA